MHAQQIANVETDKFVLEIIAEFVLVHPTLTVLEMYVEMAFVKEDDLFPKL